MLSGIDWANNPENKKDLIKLVCSHFQTDEGRNLFAILLIISRGKNAWKISKDKTEVFQISKHEEASTKLSWVTFTRSKFACWKTKTCSFTVICFGECS